MYEKMKKGDLGENEKLINKQLQKDQGYRERMHQLRGRLGMKSRTEKNKIQRGRYGMDM